MTDENRNNNEEIQQNLKAVDELLEWRVGDDELYGPIELTLLDARHLLA